MKAQEDIDISYSYSAEMAFHALPRADNDAHQPSYPDDQQTNDTGGTQQQDVHLHQEYVLHFPSMGPTRQQQQEGISNWDSLSTLDTLNAVLALLDEEDDDDIVCEGEEERSCFEDTSASS